MLFSQPEGAPQTAAKYDEAQLKELLLQMVETELGGEQVYRTALTCATNDDLRKEWAQYLEETLTHQEVIRGVCEALGVDPEEESPGRAVVRHQGQSLVKAMEMAKATAPKTGRVAERATGQTAKTLKAAHEEVERDEDHHYYHTKGWCRELWIESLGMPAVLPPPEEEKDVESAIGAARAEQQRDTLL